MIKIITVCLTLLLLPGCAITEYLKDYLAEAVDTNQYEAAREIE